MISANSFLVFFIIVIIVLLIETSNGVAAAGRELSNNLLLQSYDDDDGHHHHVPTHLSFFRSAFRGRNRVLSCSNDADICLDREKNPWGGSTCCFRQFCKDVLRDSNNCGACGKACGYGLVCCHGKCVDLQNDPQNCGSCFQQCPGLSRCSFAMCDYGG